MDTRRDFIKKSVVLSGSMGFAQAMPGSIQRALAINPDPGSTYLDAEHVVILMQENRSFDHCFGSLRGVRGFNDPRAITLPDKNLVWLQTNAAGKTYAPFRFNIKDTKITWMGSVPHSRSSQVDANNNGKYDQWLNAKRPAHEKYADAPLTLGHYTREDLPFHYSMADAFTICDQNFCSGMTSTWPNRLFLWSGTIREKQNINAKAYIRNDIPYGEAKWKTFPERLEENDISWKVYQNDISTGGGFSGEERSWLSNFGCNPLEWLSQYNARFSNRYIQSIQETVISLTEEIKALEKDLGSMSPGDSQFKKAQSTLEKKKEVKEEKRSELVKWSRDNFEKLSAKEKSIYQKAFSTNSKDPDFHELATLNYQEDGMDQTMTMPKGDILHQFREDVNNNQLPTVSWLVGPQNFSDHPSAPWYGAWYTSEILDILTKNPEVWKKTIFIYTYDENDGYFDHIPPFVSPAPDDKDTGKCSDGVNFNDGEYIRRENEMEEGVSKNEARSGPIGLGFRVPLIIASPWSRGGKVCSQVFDHTSSLQFLEEFLNKKYNKSIREDNITGWRRTVCGDLTSVFSEYKEDEKNKLPFLEKESVLKDIHNAKFKEAPEDYKALSAEEIVEINKDPSSSSLMSHQEKGVRPACALPYQLYAEGRLSNDKKGYEINMEAGNKAFGKRSAGSPFKIYAPGKYLLSNKDQKTFEGARSWNYAVAAGEKLSDTWPLDKFEEDGYHLRVYGPNGFYREFMGNANDPTIEISCDYQTNRILKNKLSGNIILKAHNLNKEQLYTLEITDHSNKGHKTTKKIAASGEIPIDFDLKRSFGWYDVTVGIKEHPGFVKRYAGRVETGKESMSDPAMAE